MEPQSHNLVPLGSAAADNCGIRLIVCPRPFSTRRVEMEMEAGRYVGDMVEEAIGQQMLALAGAHVFVGDRLVPREWWWRVKPRPGQTVMVRVVPRGGGDGGKDPLRMVLMIAVIAASFILPGAILGAELAAQTIFGSLTVGQAVGFGIPIVGPLLLNATEPPR